MHGAILIIDDDAGILEAIQALLEDEGYDVIASPTPAPALELTTSATPLPALLLLDVLLSGADGREVCRTLRSYPRTQSLPILMMSANPEARLTSSECGANGFLAKPFDVDDLLNKVQALL